MKQRLRKYRSYIRVFSLYRYKELCITITLSFIRYIVFSCQYYLLLKLFSVPVSFFEGLLLISLVFFVVSVIPTVTLTELGIRDSVALYFFTVYLAKQGIVSSQVTVGVLSASTVLWIINLALPAVLGTFFVFRLKFFRKSNSQP